jgi:hypothetical protein
VVLLGRRQRTPEQEKVQEMLHLPQAPRLWCVERHRQRLRLPARLTTERTKELAGRYGIKLAVTKTQYDADIVIYFLSFFPSFFL